VELLRQGVVNLGVTIRLAFFQPAHGLTPELPELYAANRVNVTHQLTYEPGSTKTLDLVLLVNGIPTATAELKNPLKNQDVERAISQRRGGRDTANVTLARRALLLFAVDPDQVAMTTKLAGQVNSIPALHLRSASTSVTNCFSTSSKRSGLPIPTLSTRRSNALENFPLVFDQRFLDTIVSRMDEDEAAFKRILDDEEFPRS